MRDDRDMQAHMDWDCVHLNAAKHGLAAALPIRPTWAQTTLDKAQS